MKILVFDVPASETGALTVLVDFFEYISNTDFPEIEWIFVISTNALDSLITKKPIHIIKYPYVKDGWLKRILFELFKAPHLVKTIKPDVIFSLQNTAILWSNIPQVVYIHQPIPYADWRFSLFKKNERKLAIISFIFSRIIGWSIKKSNSSIVQTRWMKDAILKRHKIDSTKIHVVNQQVNLNAFIDITYQRIPGYFFYPAAPFTYKKIEELVYAAHLLKLSGFNPIIYLTITGTENNYAKSIKDKISHLDLTSNFVLLGRIPRKNVLQLYSSCVLIFTSCIESFGLPLLEARTLGMPIIATEHPFSLEILEGYDQATFINQGNPAHLAESMKSYFSPNIKDHSPSDNNKIFIERNFNDGWSKVIKIIIDSARIFNDVFCT